MPSRRIVVELIGDSDSLERAFTRSQRKGEQFGRSMGLSAIPLKSYAKAGLAGAAVGGLALLTKQIGSSVSAAKEAQVAQVKLRQALGAAGKSYRLYGKQIDLAITRTSKLAAIDDEELSDSFANLVRTTGSVTKAIEGMNLATDIARARNISLESATKIVERTLNGQFLSLRRVGVQIDKNMTATEAIDAAQRKFAGSAEAYGRTAAGAQERLGVAFENLQEKLGQKLVPILTKVAIKLTALIEWGEENWPKFSKAVEEAWADIRPVFEAFQRYFGGWVKIIQGIIEGDWSLIWAGLKQSVKAGMDLVFEYLKAVPANLFKVGVRMGRALADGVISGIGNLVDRVLDKIPFLGDEGIPKSIQRQIDAARARAQRQRTPTVGAVSGAEHHPGRRHGGLVRAGRSYTVGEGGPETLTMGRTSGYVTPGVGGGIVIQNAHFYGVQNVRELVAELERYAKHGTSQTRGAFGGQNLALG